MNNKDDNPLKNSVEIDTTNIKIETDRLILRAWTQDDLQDFYNYSSVPGVGEAAGWFHHESIEHSQQILGMFLKSKETLALYHKKDKKVIGSAGLHATSWASADERFKYLKSAEIGYVLSKAYWGKGLMTEAARALIAYTFDNLGVELMVCSHFIENNNSRRVIEKCGFSFVENGEYYSSQMDKTFASMRYILLKG